MLKGKIQKKWVATYIDSSLSPATPAYVRLGKDLEELVNELNPNVVTKKNILGETNVYVDGYEKSASVEPYVAEIGEPLYQRLQKIVDEEQILDDLATTVIEVRLWEEDTVKKGSFTAYRENAVIAVQSTGVGEDNLTFPFEIHYTGGRVKGLFDISTKTFTAVAPTP